MSTATHSSLPFLTFDFFRPPSSSSPSFYSSHNSPQKTNENDSSLTSVTSSESTSLSIYSLTVLIFSIESFFSSSLRSVAVSICFSADVFSLPVSLKQRGKRRVGLAVASSLRWSTSHDVKKKKKVTCFFTSSRMERRLHSSSQSCWRWGFVKRAVRRESFDNWWGLWRIRSHRQTRRRTCCLTSRTARLSCAFYRLLCWLKQLRGSRRVEMPTFGLFVLLFRLEESGSGVCDGLVERSFLRSEAF